MSLFPARQGRKERASLRFLVVREEKRDTIDLSLIRFDLSTEKDWELFYSMCASYYQEVCSPEEFRQEMADLRDETLNMQLIAQTRQKENPYFVMKILLGGEAIGMVAFSYREALRLGFLENVYISPQWRAQGLGRAVIAAVEERLAGLGAERLELLPVAQAKGFYRRIGFVPLRTAPDGEEVYGKRLCP